MTFRTLLAASAAFALACPAAAQSDEDKPVSAPIEAYEANSASETFTGTFGGRSVRYTATVEEQVLEAEDGTPKAAIVTTSYIAEPRDPSRPVTFLFNGGPGSGSVWLQMGAFGPSGSRSLPTRATTVRRPTPFSTIPIRSSTSPIWSSSIRSGRVSAIRSARPRARNTGASPRMRNRSPRSSASG